jgi:hypothetical protein
MSTLSFELKTRLEFIADQYEKAGSNNKHNQDWDEFIEEQFVDWLIAKFREDMAL